MPMGATELAAVVTRLKREGHKRTKHDSQFSKWKVLIGPDDWVDYSIGKEGVARYRVENLPKNSSSGLYELAIYRSGSSSRENTGKLDRYKVLVVYLGEADNVRTRLQQYGRTGAHLGRSSSGEKGCGYFEDIFSRGYSIVYRWAPMENKADAQRTEAQLLNTFDYAWNKGSNGARRHDNILRKLDKGASNRTPPAIFSRKLLPFHQKQVGIKIKASKLLSQDSEFSKYSDGEGYNFLWQVFKFSRSQPRLVFDRGGSNENDTIICGVVLVDGSICRRPPLEGRKRCAEHKGKKTRGSSVSLSTSEKSHTHKACSDYVIFGNGEYNVNGSKIPSFGTVPSLIAGDCPAIERCSPICEVAMDDGSLCTRQPVSGRKRCDEHKGRKICNSNSETTRYQTVPYVVSDSYANDALGFDKKSSETFIRGKVETGVAPHRPVFNDGCDTICGVELGNGYFCTKQPVRGRVRCEEHKGLRVTSLLSRFDAKSTSHDFDMDPRFNSHNWKYGRSSSSTTICGAPTRNGSSCQRTVNGNGRCWQHSNYGCSSISSSSNFSTKNSNYGDSSTSICGAPTRNGSFCQRKVKGNGRCWQH
ncbi:PREDICTED: protein EFFECTOR OF TRANSCRIPTION 2 [Theobroma cacao]|uniref:Protein EFFECTOR OF TRANSCRIPTION 2 n=1 Tax=Theobroma cacao TaxID=3641 RepID=A0AB32UPJ5_THECC|nr:PREDICTED: protein EFFECTOR OF TRANSCRIPTION 2 [Theobroma cacao]